MTVALAGILVLALAGNAWGQESISSRLKEAVLPSDDANAEIYRFTVVPAFFNPISVRIQKNGSEVVLVAKRLSGLGGYDAGTLKAEKKRTLREQQWNQVMALVKEAGFWELPSEQETSKPVDGRETICLDGAAWTIEGVRAGRYHHVNRHCEGIKAIRALGLYLAGISGLGVREHELY